MLGQHLAGLGVVAEHGEQARVGALDRGHPVQSVEKESELIAVAQAAGHLMDHVWSKLTLPVATGAAADKAAEVQSRAG